MSRDIKFRAWNKVTKTMYNSAIYNCKDSFDMILKHPQIYDVMQYTGLNDKNDVEIYEGDILEYRSSKEWGIGEIIWDISRLSFAINFVKPNIEDALLFYFQCKDEIEVTGNMYENSEKV